MRFLLLALLAAGCGPGGDGAPELALEDDGFAPLVDGQEVSLVAGAQGGFHVWMNVRVHGAAPDPAVIARSAHRVADGALVLRSTTAVELDAAGVTLAPLPLFMCPSPVGLSVVDTPIRFELRLETARRAVTLVPRCPPEARELCLKICTG